MAVMTLREKHVPIVPCMCPRCRAAVLEMPDGERRWEQRARLAYRLQENLRRRLVDSLDDECEMAERRRPLRRAVDIAGQT